MTSQHEAITAVNECYRSNSLRDDSSTRGLTTLDLNEIDTVNDGIEAIITDEEFQRRMHINTAFERWMDAYVSLIHVMD